MAKPQSFTRTGASEMVKHYFLIARNGTNEASKMFHSTDDRTAIGDAAMLIMKLAYPNQEPWASGHIELHNEIDVVLAEMKAKETE